MSEEDEELVDVEFDSVFLDKRVVFQLSDGPLDCVVVDVVEESGNTFFYKVLLDGGKCCYIALQDIGHAAIIEDFAPKPISGI